jgi:hypothetical protein
MKIERLTIDLSSGRATLLYEDGKETGATIPKALEQWQEFHRQLGLPIGELQISSVDELFQAMEILSKNHKGNHKGNRN